MRSGLTQRIATGIPNIGSLLPLICGSTVCLGSSLGYKSVPECCEASAKWISACAQIAVAGGAPQQFCQDLLSSCPPRLQLATRVPARRRRGAVGLGSSQKIPCRTHTFCRFAVFRNAISQRDRRASQTQALHGRMRVNLLGSLPARGTRLRARGRWVGARGALTGQAKLENGEGLARQGPGHGCATNGVRQRRLLRPPSSVH